MTGAPDVRAAVMVFRSSAMEVVIINKMPNARALLKLILKLFSFQDWG
jgi:hypothetical protein